MRLVISIILITLIIGCAGSNYKNNINNEEYQYNSSLLEKHNQELTSYAALLRVKLKRRGKVDDFRVELYSDQNRGLSLYVRGFLGKSVLKAVIKNDSLELYFPSNKSIYRGYRNDLLVGVLSNAESIIGTLLEIFNGSLNLPESSDQDKSIKSKGNSLYITESDSTLGSTLTSKYHLDRNTFPYFTASEIDLETSSGTLKVHLEFKNKKYNQSIPESKFEINAPSATYQLNRTEMVELLTEIS